MGVLSGLKTTTDALVSVSLPTTAPFTPSPTGAAKTSCDAIVSQAKTLDVATFLSNYAINDKTTTSSPDVSIKDKLTTFKASLTPTDTSQPITDKTGYSGPDGINTFITNLDSIHIPVIRLVDNCLKESQQIDMTDYNAAKALKEESKSRLESILTPEQHISYYEGWFPIVRPMTESSLFILFGSALFLLLLSITVFLSMTGVSVQIQIPDLVLPQILSFLNYYLPPGTSYYLYAGLFFGLVATYIAFRLKYI